jgi:hypothetical protein
VATAVAKSDHLVFQTLEMLDHFLAEHEIILNVSPYDANAAVAEIIQKNDIRKAQLTGIEASGDGAACGGSFGSASKLSNDESMVFEWGDYKRLADHLATAQTQEGSVGVLSAEDMSDSQYMIKITVSRKSLGAVTK